MFLGLLFFAVEICTFEHVFQTTDCYQIRKMIQIPLGKGKNALNVSLDYEDHRVPTSFDIDSKGRVYLPDEIGFRIKVFQKSKCTAEIPVGESMGKLIVQENKQSIFVWGNKSKKVFQFSMNGDKLGEFSPSMDDQGLVDFVVDNDNLLVVTTTWSPAGRRYFLQQIEIRGKASDKTLLNLSKVVEPLSHRSIVTVNHGKLFIPAKGAIYVITKNEAMDSIKCETMIESQGLLYFDGTTGYSVNCDGEIMIRRISIDRRLNNEVNLVPGLEKIFRGKFGKDFMDGPMGFIYDVKFKNGSIYLMGSSQSATFVFQIKVLC